MPRNLEDARFPVALALAPGLTDWEKVKLVEKLGSAREVLNAFIESERKGALERADREISECRKSGYSILTRGGPGFPELLDRIPDPPLALFSWGALSATDDLALAIVGARRATPYGLQMAETLSADLARRGVTLVSGLARGIDAVVHRAALEAGGRTVAVLGSGLHYVYPREHLGLAERIARSGALLTEHPTDAPPLALNFPRRNRILSGLALGTLVVEAASRSGSLITARHALEQGRDVFAVPGPVGAPTSEGCHALIQEGAKLVTCARDVVEELREETRDRLRPAADQVPAATPALTDDEAHVLSRLPRYGAIDPDRLASRALPAHRVLAALSGLELKGLVDSYPGATYGRAARGGPPK